MAANPDNSQSLANLDFSGLARFALPGGVVFTPGGYTGIASALLHGDYVDTSVVPNTKTGQLTAGSLVSSGAIGAAGGITGASIAAVGGITAGTTIAAGGKITSHVGGGVNLAWYNILDYGALGNNSQDEAPAINAAIAAAVAAGGGHVYMPWGANGAYLLNSVVTFHPRVSFEMHPGVLVAAYPGYQGSAFTWVAGNYWSGEKYRFAYIANFLGPTAAALFIPDNVSILDVYAQAIQSNNYGVYMSTAVANFGNSIRWLYLVLCKYGIYQELQTVTAQAQGNYFGGPQSSIGDCNNAVYITQVAASAAPNVAYGNNVYDFATVNGNAAGFTGITFNNILLCVMNLFRICSSFGACQGGFVTATGGSIVRAQAFELVISETRNPTSPYGGAYTDFNAFNTGGQVPTSSLRIIGATSDGSTSAAGTFAPGNGSSPLNNSYPAMTVPNSRSSFNGGVPLYFKRFIIQCTLPSMTTGQIATFYCYSPFTTGVPNHPQATMVNSSQVLVSVSSCQDDSVFPSAFTSAHNANEICVQLIAGQSIGAGLPVFVSISVMD